ncbi:CDP-alcohol phosphatidyltransferase family protein [Brevundimonas sp.]|uniref:CDP-alcohol phosphatidyltransferase family protein n=1 Tax=Brevundimonas sp. TaxID=1871086 RepID=UPI002D298F5E|nr:CDP-alcohol phosphatidyltransferase family protein [Brevundimonas sp.]HYC66746.1 CDP-alcohol phosphatidyltransferase family protein [Brevundimonas sp.]
MLPNLITGVRLLALVPLYVLVAHGGEASRGAALALFLLAGASDIADGWLARRLGLGSAFGAFLDLVADRLLTLAAVAGLIAAGRLPGGWAAAGLVLVVRDLAVAGLNETFAGLGIRVTPAEKAKVALQFLGLALLIAPGWAEAQLWIGRGALGLAALLAALLTLGYVRRALGPSAGAA